MTTKWTSTKLREAFIEYFKTSNHTIVDSSSVIPHNDPTLLFVNSGMVQFKPVFLNQPCQFSELKRAASIQRCIRAGGKHNDLEDVGFDTYHHTFFEMMGNWSFGDYGKEQAIDLAFRFLTEELQLDKNRIYVSYYVPEGWKDGKQTGAQTQAEVQEDAVALEADYETKGIWMKYLPESRILPFTKENFWEMGDTGPCGPCTEIHYDLKGTNGPEQVNKDDPSCIEIWNLVFMQFYRNEQGTLSRLDKLSVDTGMGMERVLGILNGTNNYDTDLFIPLFEMTGLSYSRHENFEKENNTEGLRTLSDNVALRIIADHARTIAICLFYDISFSSDGAGYVLRRITRRMIRVLHNKNLHNLKELVLKAADILEIPLADSKMEQLENEQKLFEKTLNQGVKYFNQFKTITAKEMFILKDTYGFPFDLTEQMCREKGIVIDKNELKKLVEEGIERSKVKKKAGVAIKDSWNVEYEPTKEFLERDYENFDSSLFFVFDGSRIIEEKDHEQLTDREIGLVADRTCFYSEKGGQIGDAGVIVFMDENGNAIGKMNVNDTQRNQKYVVHKGTVEGQVSKMLNMKVDLDRRFKIRCNHTAAHLLFQIINEKLGSAKKGTLVADDRFRLDYTMNRKLENDEIKEMEDKLNEMLVADHSVKIYEKRYEDVKNENIYIEDEGIYPDIVRIAEVNGDKVLCGGLHVNNLAQIKCFKIISEYRVNSNVRRIIAYTHDRALECHDNALKIESFELSTCHEWEDNLGLLDKLRFLSIKQTKLKESIKIRNEKVRLYCRSEKPVIFTELIGDKTSILKDLNTIFTNISKKDKNVMVLTRIGDVHFFICSNDEKFTNYLKRWDTHNIIILSKKVRGEIKRLNPDDFISNFN